MRLVIDWLDRVTRREGVYRAVLACAVIGCILLFALLFVRVGALSHTANENADQLASAAATARARGDALGTANDRLHSAGQPTVEPSSPKPNPTDTKVGDVPPVTGPAGPVGAAGRGIVSTSIKRGHLIVRYDDGVSHDAGQVVGATGKTGAQGAPGRGITAANIVQGELVLSYSDGTSKTLGKVVGPAGADGKNGKDGRGIASITRSADNHLILTYTDGDSVDLGPIPAGPKGDTGPAGPPGKDGTNGKDGKDGVSIKSITCGQDDNDWHITLSDGTVQDVDGPCRATTATTTVTAPPASTSTSTPPPVTK